jgi:peptidoglycan/xylan/chitin deacetylase (PgdA/CDA1 family)
MKRFLHILSLALVPLAGLVLAGAGAARTSGSTAQPLLEWKVAPKAFSPNGDGVKDTLRVDVTVDEPTNLTIEIADDNSTVVFSNAPGATVQAGLVHFRWNGRTGSGRGPRAPDGHYTVHATAVDATAGQADVEARILLDTHAPYIAWGRLYPSLLERGPLYLRYRVYDRSDQVRLRLKLTDQTGAPRRTGAATVQAPGPVRSRWPRTHAAHLVPGVYRMALAATDQAGNSTTSKTRTFLVSHPVRSRVYALYRGVGRRIALTFDDCGSSGAWGSILDTLARFRVKATFFCPGQQVLAFAAEARRTVREGHAIGSHGWDHADFSHLSFGASVQRLDYDRRVWWNLAHVAPTPYFRPPYGAYTRTTMAAAGRAGYAAVVLWDVDPRDWSRPGVRAIEQRVLGPTRPGSIVLMHVIDQTAAALPTIIAGFRFRHLTMLTLPELDRIGTAIPGGWPAYSSARSGS